MDNAAKPQGFLGGVMINLMNKSHVSIWDWGVEHLKLRPTDSVIDIGCGGGLNVRRFTEICSEGKVTGLDYSPLSVEKSREINAEAIRAGRCEIVEADVAAMPFDDNTFDVATAFETIYFWGENSFREVHRVLKTGGTFMIVCGSSGSGQVDNVWDNFVEGMHTRSEDEIVSELRDAGFKNIELDTKNIGKKFMRWLNVLAVK